MGIFSNWFKGFRYNEIIRDKSGNWSFWLGETPFGNEKNFLEWSLKNPILMTVIAIRAKLYSQMEITHYNSRGRKIELKESPYLKLLKKPNYFQSQQDWLYQQMWFMSATGENYIYNVKPVTAEVPLKMYNLIPTDVDFKDIMRLKEFLLTDKQEKEFEKQSVKYSLDGQNINLPISSLIPLYDLANGLVSNSWMTSPSRVSGLKDVLCNIDENLKSKNINLKMSQKYLGKNKQDISGQPLIKQTDREAIEQKLGQKSIILSNTDIEISHLVSDFKKLFLDEMMAYDANVVLTAFEQNKDVLNYFQGSASTFENQEMGTIRYIQTAIQSDADNTMNSLMQAWGLVDKGEVLKASFNHLPIMQAVMKSKIETFSSYQSALSTAIANQTLTPEEAKEMSDNLKKELGL